MLAFWKVTLGCQLEPPHRPRLHPPPPATISPTPPRGPPPLASANGMWTRRATGRRWALYSWVLPGLPSWARGQKNQKGASSHWMPAQTNLWLWYGLKTSSLFTVSIKTMSSEYSMCACAFVFIYLMYECPLKDKEILHSEDTLHLHNGSV